MNPISLRPAACSAFVAVLVAGAASAGQVCNERIDFATPNSRFIVNAIGTVTDVRTGLTWQRCPVGYTFGDRGTSILEDDVCEPGEDVKLTWQQALESAVQASLGSEFGFSDWRLPNRSELASLEETRCHRPAINLRIFPATPAALFWTSSVFIAGDTTAWAFDFSVGGDGSATKSTALPVRLVR